MPSVLLKVKRNVSSDASPEFIVHFYQHREKFLNGTWFPGALCILIQMPPNLEYRQSSAFPPFSSYSVSIFLRTPMAGVFFQFYPNCCESESHFPIACSITWGTCLVLAVVHSTVYLNFILGKKKDLQIIFFGGITFFSYSHSKTFILFSYFYFSFLPILFYSII